MPVLILRVLPSLPPLGRLTLRAKKKTRGLGTG
jgi:hypothetical protein